MIPVVVRQALPKWYQNCSRQLSLSSVHQIKSIKRVEEGNKVIIEAQYEPSPREPYLAKPLVVNSVPRSVSYSECECSLCKLGLHIKHTDVLILTQYTDSKGKQLPRDVTGLCNEQHKRLDYLLVMAEKAGLIDVYNKDSNKKELTGWERFNKYYDEAAIELFLQNKARRA